MKIHKTKIIDWQGFKCFIDEDVPKDTIILYDPNTIKFDNNALTIEDYKKIYKIKID